MADCRLPIAACELIAAAQSAAVRRQPLISLVVTALFFSGAGRTMPKMFHLRVLMHHYPEPLEFDTCLQRK